MRFFFSLLFISVYSNCVIAQYVLETPDGKMVKLNQNRTWEFIPVLESVTKKKESSKYISRYKKFEINFDKLQWRYDTTDANDGLRWDVNFYSKDQAITGYCLESRLSMSVNDIQTYIKQQWEGIGLVKDLTTKEEILNGTNYIRFDMLLDYAGLPYQYRGYISPGPKGSFQVIIGSQQHIFEEDIQMIEQFFKGIKKL